jgi:ATP-dependent RNA helicase DDX31/DBP7
LTTSTHIQSVTLPLLLRHQNVLIKSQTGSGKTLAYLLPLMHDLITSDDKISRDQGTRALIIAPTRELCQQIASVLMKLTSVSVNIVAGSLSGNYSV